RQVVQEPYPGWQRRVRQCCHPPGNLRGEGRRLRLWQLPGYRCAVSPAGDRAGSRPARSDAEQDAAAYVRGRDLRADLAARVHQWRRPAGWGVGLWPDPRLSVHVALRGPDAEIDITRVNATRLATTSAETKSVRGGSEDEQARSACPPRGRCGRVCIGAARRSGSVDTLPWRGFAAAVRRCAGRASDMGRTHLPGANLVRSGRDAGHHHAVHVDVRDARRDGEADAWRPAYAVPRGILVRSGRRPLLRIRAARGDKISQRRSDNSRRCEVLVRALSRYIVRCVETTGGSGRNTGSAARGLSPEGSVAGLSYVLRYRRGCRLDRAPEIRGESGG